MLIITSFWQAIGQQRTCLWRKYSTVIWQKWHFHAGTCSTNYWYCSCMQNFLNPTNFLLQSRSNECIIFSLVESYYWAQKIKKNAYTSKAGKYLENLSSLVVKRKPNYVAQEFLLKAQNFAISMESRTLKLWLVLCICSFWQRGINFYMIVWNLLSSIFVTIIKSMRVLPSFWSMIWCCVFFFAIAWSCRSSRLRCIGWIRQNHWSSVTSGSKPGTVQ